MLASSNRERLWRAMRQLRGFDARQLQMVTETAEDTVQTFVNGLRRTGYLVKRGRRLMLIRDTGPRPPKLRTTGRPFFHLIGVEDRNTGARYGVDGGPEPAVLRCARGRRRATASEKAELVRRFKQTPDAGFLESLDVPFAVSAASLHRWCRIVEREGFDGLARPRGKRPGRRSVWERSPALLAKAAAILKADRTLSAVRLQAALMPPKTAPGRPGSAAAAMLRQLLGARSQ